MDMSLDVLIKHWNNRMEELKIAIADSNKTAATYAERLMFDKALLYQNMGREHMQEYRAIRRCRNELTQLKEQDNG